MLATENKVEISELINQLIHSEVAFAMYRLPKQNDAHLVVSNNDFIPIDKVDFEELSQGFVYAPYDSQYSKIQFLPADYFATFNIDEKNLDISDLKCNLINIPSSKEGFCVQLFPNDADKPLYLEEANEIIARIKKGEAHKVVLSRKKKLGKLVEKHYYSAFLKLCQAYPDAMISLVYLRPLNQIWLGASPEILVSQDKNGIFRTVALAGTQSATDANGNEILPVDALWRAKEIEEQALVSRYIINCLKKIRVREFIEEGPKTVKAGNLLHLKTTYSIDNKDVNFPNLSSVMLDLLHPTPAVCGMPKQEAEQILSEVEKHNREFYSGYLGPVNLDKESHLFVNLRTIKVENDVVYAYAGGGYLEDSKPEQEWLETEIKIKTISKAFDNDSLHFE